MNALLLRADGTEEVVVPANGKEFSLEEMQKLTNSEYIDLVPLGPGSKLVVNDEGKLNGLPVNENASAIFRKRFPLNEYPINNDGTIVGDVLFVSTTAYGCKDDEPHQFRDGEGWRPRCARCGAGR